MMYALGLLLSLMFAVQSQAKLKDKRQTHTVCGQFPENTEHYATCTSYGSSKVRIVNNGANLETEISEASEGDLLIIPVNSVGSAYRINAPLKLKKGMGLLAGASGSDGFFHITPSNDFSIGSDPVYCAMVLGENSRVTGVAMNAGTFSGPAVTYMNGLTVEKVLIYSQGISSYTMTASKLYGRPGMKAAFWGNNAINRTDVTGGTVHKIGRSWLDNGGADYAALISTASHASNPEEVDLKHLVIRNSALASGSSVQRGLYVQNAAGQIEHNYFSSDDSSINTGQNRYQLTLDSLLDPRKNKQATIAENYFHTHRQLIQEKDTAIQFLEAEGESLEVEVFANQFTETLIASGGNSFGVGSKIDIKEVYTAKPLPFELTEDEFFKNTAMPVIFPRGGVCFAPLFALDNLNRTQSEIGSNGWAELCGSSLKRSAFNLDEAFTGTQCPESDCSYGGYIGSLVFSLTGNVVQTVYGIVVTSLFVRLYRLKKGLMSDTE